ncbi:MAG: hypothetical protein NTZ32_03040 [Planctomycetales bacterium]|nr:hypothetical protein [Planctomycetales bacterium]
MTWLVHHADSISMDECLATAAFLTATIRQQREIALEDVPHFTEARHSKNALPRWE